MTVTPTILVTGGTGTLGRKVVERLRTSGHEPRVLSRKGRNGTLRGNLLTGEGVDQAVDGVSTIIHCATIPTWRTRTLEVENTARLLRAAARAGVSHVVYISIVGIDRNPFPYYRAKLEAEGVVERSGVPSTILRATQFHDFVHTLLRPLARLPVAAVPKGVLLQPIDTGEVADRLVELALADPAGRVPDIGGPETRTASDLARSFMVATGRNRRTLEVPFPGRMARAFREGAQTCPDHARGTIGWEAFLQNRYRQQSS